MKKARFLLLLFIATLAVNLLAPQPKAEAANARDYMAGLIIDDSVFTNNNAMTTGQIQSFLDSKVPSCAIATCLKNYRQNPQTGADNYGNGGNPAGSLSAAELIKVFSDQFGINPQVILVTLQKENGLVTNTQPSLSRFQQAMGYGCPDNTAPGAPACNPATGTFSAQIYQGARHFRGYFDAPPGWWVTFTTGNNNIPYSPTAACGSSTVYIQNRATAALYTYTPYQPNADSLNAGYGDAPGGCDSHGNRNFFLFFSDWFGSPIVPTSCPANEQPYAEVMRLYDPVTYKHFYTTSICEVQIVSKGLKYNFEGTAFYQTASNSPYAVVVHRLYNPQTHMHLWATTQEDINNATQYAGYRYEGPAFYAVKPEVPRSVVVHRLYNPQTYMHLWSTTQEEINSATQYSGYRYEGPAFWAAPPPS
jgi:hypothetical protein